VVALGYDALGPTALIIMIVAMLFSWLADRQRTPSFPG